MIASDEGLGRYNPSDARLCFVFPFPTRILTGFLAAKRLRFELEGLAFPIGDPVKKAVQHLIAYELPEEHETH